MMETCKTQVESLAVMKAATSMTQTVEWRMRVVKSSFPRLKVTLVFEEHGKTEIMFTCLFFLYNLHSQLVLTRLQICTCQISILTMLIWSLFHMIDNNFSTQLKSFALSSYFNLIFNKDPVTSSVLYSITF
jgi:hypothetical protein